MKITVAVFVVFCIASPAMAQDPQPKCFFLCPPKLKIEPTFTWENWVQAPRVQETDSQGNTTVQEA